MDVISLSLVAVVITFFLLWRQYGQRRTPPGPRYYIPFLGNLLQMDPEKPHQSLRTWAGRYGDIYQIHLLGQDVIVLSGYDVIHEALVTKMDTFAGRPHFFRFLYFYYFDMHITFNDISPRCRQLKKTAMNALKIYGDGLENLQDICTGVIGKLTETIDAYEGRPFDPLDATQTATTNVIYSMLFGETLEDPDALKIVEHQLRLNEVTSPSGRGAELDLAPWLRHFPNSTMKQLHLLREEAREFFDVRLAARKQSSREGVECVVDALFQNEKESPDDEVESGFTYGEIRATVIELIGAGLLTSGSALYSLLAMCVARPEIQQRLQADIDNTIGARPPQLADRARLPYVQAAILELLRYISHVPVAIPHKTTQDVELRGYKLPKNTEVYINLWSLHHDPRYWEDPWRYNPDRFLTPEGRLVPPDHPHRKHFMAFGAGRRVCVGEALAKNRLFLFVTSLLQRFRFLPEPDDKWPDTDPRSYEMGVVLYARRYKLRAMARERDQH